MNLLFRLLSIVLFAGWRPKLSFRDKAVLKFRVWPTDLDILMHMTNSKFLALMDVGRMDLMGRTGTFKKAVAAGVYAVVAAETIKFKKSLQLFEKFEIQTQVIGWDEKYFYIEQLFVAGDRVCAHAYVQVAFRQRGRSGAVSVKNILELASYQGVPPALPDNVRQAFPL